MFIVLTKDSVRHCHLKVKALDANCSTFALHEILGGITKNYIHYNDSLNK